jgi:hypothetical protein
MIGRRKDKSVKLFQTKSIDLTHHSPSTRVPSARSTILRVLTCAFEYEDTDDTEDAEASPGIGGADVELRTAAVKSLADLHIIQCLGMFAGLSAMRTPTGVRSPVQYWLESGRIQRIVFRRTVSYINMNLFQLEIWWRDWIPRDVQECRLVCSD